jgi:hypothetical protein
MMAWMVGGSERHLRAATNGFQFVEQQSFATGGWGPDEQLRAAGSDDLFTSLTKSHASFETPCGSYAHFKITRYLLRVTRDSRYGDSMERMMYNTVLGSKPLQNNGDAFYYSDYNFDGLCVYHSGRWPCCSGTLPQVAADYRIQAYFHDDRDLFVNLYIPSTVRWARGGTAFSLSQRSFWPYEPQIGFVVNASSPFETTLHFRIPQWTQGATLAVNGKRWTGPVEPGTFAAVRRTWQDGDRVDLEIPLPMRLEPIDAQHPNIVAVMRGPLVLFALKPQQDTPMPPFDRRALLAMRRSSQREWLTAASDSPSLVRFVPFTEVGAEAYTTYLQTT